MHAASIIIELLWIGAIVAAPLALMVGVVCRWRGLRPATRHALWTAVLLSFICPAAVGAFWRAEWFRSDRVLAALPPAPLPLPEGGGWGKGSSAPPASFGWTDAPHRLFDRSTDPATAPSAPWSSETCPDDPSTPAAQFASLAGAALRGLLAPAPAAPDAAAPTAEPLPAESAAAPWLADLRPWIGQALTVRDSIASLPPLPAAIWLGGGGALLLSHLLGAWCVSRRLARGSPPGAETAQLVRAVAGALGLNRVPRTAIVEDAVSPMIWCGPRPVLVLPGVLWRSLDRESRRAVLMHELAHLRRGDHVLCWLGGLIGVLYWWHPVAWWVRRRLRDEADACCDAWVTSLLPTSRRAYAEALVATGSFLNVRSRAPGLALRVMSNPARKLARRIAMVMTQRVAPRVSPFGLLAAAAVVALGAIVMPGLACPPKEGQKAEAKAKGPAVIVTTRPAPLAPAAPHTPAAHGTSAAPAGPHSQPFLGEAPALEAMRGGPRSQVSQQAPRAAVIAQAGDETIEREYRLPEGKLKALVALMAREDVPILIQSKDKSIIVHATPRQHDVFKAFVVLINPDGQQPGQGLRLLEMTAPASGTTAAVAVAQSREQALKQLRDSMRNLERDRAKIERDADKVREQSEKARERSGELRELVDQIKEQSSRAADQAEKAALAQAAQNLAARAEAAKASAGEMTARLKQMEQQMAQIERQAAQMEKQIDAMEKQVDEKSSGRRSDATRADQLKTEAKAGKEAKTEKGDKGEKGPKAPKGVKTTTSGVHPSPLPEVPADPSIDAPAPPAAPSAPEAPAPASPADPAAPTPAPQP